MDIIAEVFQGEDLYFLEEGLALELPGALEEVEEIEAEGELNKVKQLLVVGGLVDQLHLLLIEEVGQKEGNHHQLEGFQKQLLQGLIFDDLHKLVDVSSLEKDFERVSNGLVWENALAYQLVDVHESLVEFRKRLQNRFVR